jgi:hypothetical protein
MERPEKPMFTDEQRAFFRACAARRGRVDTTCIACGASLQNVVRKRRFCNNVCAQRHYRAQRRGAPVDGE